MPKIFPTKNSKAGDHLGDLAEKGRTLLKTELNMHRMWRYELESFLSRIWSHLMVLWTSGWMFRLHERNLL